MLITFITYLHTVCVCQLRFFQKLNPFLYFFQNIAAVCFHPELPVILTGSEDGTVRVWHANTYRLENTLNYGLERVWTIASLKGSNDVAIGYDEGSILIKLGREEPAMSMDSSGKIVW